MEYPTVTTDLPFLINLWLNCFSLSAKSVQLESKVSAAFQTIKSIAVEFFPFSCKFLDKLLQFTCKISATVNFLHCTDFALKLHQLKVKSIPWFNAEKKKLLQQNTPPRVVSAVHKCQCCPCHLHWLWTPMQALRINTSHKIKQTLLCVEWLANVM